MPPISDKHRLLAEFPSRAGNMSATVLCLRGVVLSKSLSRGHGKPI